MAVKGNFFAEKREWSKLKDQILDHYLAPYLAKITMRGAPTRIADCFAGKGAFDDGSEGSPLIIARRVAEARALPYPHNPDVKAVFIEKKYAVELVINLSGKTGCEVISGEYEAWVKQFRAEPKDRNYFLYVDPYGVKSLDFGHFAGLRDVGFSSMELLINLNTTGFLREGGRLLKLDREVPDWADDLDYEEDGLNTTARMNDIAGGEYWQEILARYQAGSIDFHEAEAAFTDAYMEKMHGLFTYALNVPIMERSHHMPKYRLVFATDHHAGFFLMAGEMTKAWRTLLANERAGQLYLFDDAQDKGSSIQDRIKAEISTPLELRELLTRLIRKHSIGHSPAEYSNAIKEGEGTLFAVTRDPALTKTGKASRTMDYDDAEIMVGIGTGFSVVPPRATQLELL